MSETWDATESAERVRRGDVTARELIDAAIARAEAAQGLGAIVTPTFEAARSSPVRPGPLSGVPVFIKDLTQVAGVRTAWGSQAAGEYVSRRSDTFARRFLATGVVSLGKSATPELGLTATTEPIGWPPCRNPWAPDRTPGGSSGGAAALVASGVVPIAHASDGGGSIRIPAAACGLVGLKPSRHRIDMEGSGLLPVNVATDGIVSRTVRDTIAFYAAIEGPRARLPPIGPVTSSRARAPLKIGVFVRPPRGGPVDPEHAEAARGMGRLLASFGHHVEEIECPFEAQVIDDFLAFWAFLAWMQIVGARILMHPGVDRARFEPWTRGMADRFRSARWSALRATWRLRGFAAKYDRILRERDVLISPTVAHPPPRLGHFSGELPFSTVYERLCEFAAFTPIQNASGAPAISLPWSESSVGTPIGVQLAAARGNDRLLLELALAVEEARPWPLVAPPSRWSERR